MGIEAEQFVHPERISPQLFCSICTNVLENPVMTPSEHLYCEAELLDWFVTKGDQICPMTKMKLDASKIVKPGRIITNMLNELERYCTNRSEGCTWTGQNALLKTHLKTCEFHPRTTLIAENHQQKTTIKLLSSRVDILETRVKDLETERTQLIAQVAALQQTVRVYDAFVKQQEDIHDPEERGAQLEKFKGTLSRSSYWQGVYEDEDPDFDDDRSASSLLMLSAPGRKDSIPAVGRILSHNHDHKLRDDVELLDDGECDGPFDAQSKSTIGSWRK